MTETPHAELQGRRILVTGGTGFIGAPLCARLHALGAHVVAASRHPRTVPAAGVDVVSTDLADAAQTHALLERARPDVVFHLASHVVGTRAVEAVLPTFVNNLTSTVNLLLAAHAAGCGRVVLTGSLEEPQPSSEWSIPSSPYAAAKAAAADYGRMFNHLFDLPVVMLRVFMVYGPGQADHAKLVPYVINSLLSGQLPRLSSGTREVDWVYVDDVVEAFVAAATKPGIAGETIDVGTGTLTSVRDVVASLFSILRPRARPEFGGAADRPMEQVRAADAERTRALLGWSASTTLTDGLTRTARWYSAQRTMERRHAQ